MYGPALLRFNSGEESPELGEVILSGRSDPMLGLRQTNSPVLGREDGDLSSDLADLKTVALGGRAPCRAAAQDTREFSAISHRDVRYVLLLPVLHLDSFPAATSPQRRSIPHETTQNPPGSIVIQIPVHR